MGNENSGTPKAALLKLDGTQIDKEGNKSETNFFSFLDIPLDNYADLEKEMTPEAAIKFRNHVVRMSVGTSAAIPMLCGGPNKCIMGKRCPFNEIKKYPITQSCPVEMNLVQAWTRAYVEELSVDTDSMSQMVLVNRLVELDLLDFRANVGLSGANDEEAPSLLKTSVTQTDTFTTESTTVHPLIDEKSKFHYERLKTLEALVATRRERYKQAQAMGQRDSNDVAKNMAELGSLISRMKNEKNTVKTINAIKEDAKLLEQENEKSGTIDADWTGPDF